MKSTGRRIEAAQNVANVRVCDEVREIDAK